MQMPDPIGAAPLKPTRSRFAPHRIFGWPVAILLALAYWGMATTAVDGKSNVFDEPLHQTGGFSYWTLRDYRIQPENGNIPQRIFGLPLALASEQYRFPPTDSAMWHRSEQWKLARRFYFDEGNGFESMLSQGRALAAVIGAGIVLLVYGLSRSLYGQAAGALSALLAAFSPNLLAHGALMTSDAALALMFPAALFCLWRSLHRLTLWTLLASGATLGVLLLTKFSALLIVPMSALLLALRFAVGRGLDVRFSGAQRRIHSRSRILLVLSGALCVQALLAFVLIWASYGFRYSAFAESEPGRDQLMESWETLSATPGPLTPIISFARERHLLPEAYLYGIAFVDRHSRARFAFLNGEYSVTGWAHFFPFAMATKTPLALFALLGLSAATFRRTSRATPDAARAGPPNATCYDAAPLWVMISVIGAASIASAINLGLRHVLPLYPALFVFAGGATQWIAWRRRVASVLVGLCACGFVLASVCIRPDYLAYFNPLVGPQHGYRHLVDSSLDWGQDLPGLAAWLREDPEVSRGAPSYLAYFGSASPRHYGVEARKLHSYHDWTETVPPRAYRLGAGVYCISATMLQTVYTNPPGPWTPLHEQRYQRARGIIEPLLVAGDPQDFVTLRGTEQRIAYRTFDELRFGRLAAHLRRREPDAQIGFSILIYRLSEDEIRSALDGPPAYADTASTRDR